MLAKAEARFLTRRPDGGAIATTAGATLGRTRASTNFSTNAVSTARADCSGGAFVVALSARQAGGMAAANWLNRWLSGPLSTGSQEARYTSPINRSEGTNRSAATSEPAKRRARLQ